MTVSHLGVTDVVVPELGLHLIIFSCSHKIKQLVKRKHVYHITPNKGKSWVAKVVATPYPWRLHQELSKLALAPKLATSKKKKKIPGGVEVVMMDYLDPADGWMPLKRFTGDWDVLQAVVFEALRSLQSCLGGKAVHGDLNPNNIYVRCAL